MARVEGRMASDDGRVDICSNMMYIEALPGIIQ